MEAPVPSGVFRPWLLSLCAALLALVVVGWLVIVPFDGEVTGLFRIGSVFEPSPLLGGRPVHVFSGEAGYDGQQFLTLALDPLLRNPGTLRALDNPSYRARRILYPALGCLLGLGKPALIPFVLVALNIGSLALLVLVLGLHMERAGMPAWLSMGALCVLGVWAVLFLSTSDLMCSALFISALFFQGARRPALAAAALALAALTREAALLLWAAFAVSALLRKEWREVRHLAWAWVPAAVWNAWVLVAVPAGGGATGERLDFGPPLKGIAETVLTLLRGGAGLKNGFEFGSFILLAACFGFLSADAFRSRRSGLPAHLCALVYLGLFVFSSRHLLGYYVDFNRVFMDAWLLLVFGLAAGRRIAARALLLLSGASAAAFVAAYGCGMI